MASVDRGGEGQRGRSALCPQATYAMPNARSRRKVRRKLAGVSSLLSRYSRRLPLCAGVSVGMGVAMCIGMRVDMRVDMLVELLYARVGVSSGYYAMPKCRQKAHVLACRLRSKGTNRRMVHLCGTPCTPCIMPRTPCDRPEAASCMPHAIGHLSARSMTSISSLSPYTAP